MQNTFEQLAKILERLELMCNGNLVLPDIEKDIVLEKLRKVYAGILSGKPSGKQPEQPKKTENYEVYQGIEEDVDLFFDTEHESYTAFNEAALKEKTAQEEEQKRLAEEQKRKEEEQKRLAEEQKRNTPSDEDDLLQFIPKPQTPKPAAQRSLNDLFSEKDGDRSLGAQFQNAKVQDLTKAISINDKFTYIKELFNNKGEEFSAAITQLNLCRNMEEAFNCLEGLKQKHFWDSTSTTYLSLCDLLRRKFN